MVTSIYNLFLKATYRVAFLLRNAQEYKSATQRCYIEKPKLVTKYKYLCIMKYDIIKAKALVSDNEVGWEDMGKGVWRKIMSYDEKLMLVKVKFKAGAIGALHHHPHLQISYIAEGEFEVTMGNETKLLKAGDVYYAVENVQHGVICIKDGLLVDIFSPMREDFL